MGSVAVGEQLNTETRPSAHKRRKDQASKRPEFGVKDSTHRRYNAIRHGILAKGVVLDGESVEEYEDLRMALAHDFETVGMVEEMWVDQLASCYWRLRRLMHAEAEGTTPLETLHRYEVGLRNEMRGIIDDLRAAQRRREATYAKDGADPATCMARDETEAYHRGAYWMAVIRDIDTDPEEARAKAEARNREYSETLEADPEAGRCQHRCETNPPQRPILDGKPTLDSLVRAHLEGGGSLMSFDEGN